MPRKRRGGYGGSSSFQFEIERYLDKESGEYLYLDDVNDDDGFEYEIVVITLNVEGHASYTPGRYYGPPEDCYPDDSEVEISSVTDEKNQDWLDKLTSREVEHIKEMLVERAQEEDYDPPDRDDYDDWRDRKYDNYDYYE